MQSSVFAPFSSEIKKYQHDHANWYENYYLDFADSIQCLENIKTAVLHNKKVLLDILTTL